MATVTTFLDWRRAVCGSGLPPGTRHVLLTLSLWAPTMGEAAFPKLTLLAEACGLSENVVRKHLKGAEKKGWIVRRARFREDGGQSSNDYVLTTPPGFAPPSQKVTPPPLTLSGRHKGRVKKGSISAENGDLFVGEGELPPGRVDYSGDFEKVWEIHAKGFKKKAFEEYRKALREKRVTRELLVKGLSAYRAGFRNGFTGCSLERWIKEDRWNNEVPAASDGRPMDEWAAEEAERWKDGSG